MRGNQAGEAFHDLLNAGLPPLLVLRSDKTLSLHFGIQPGNTPIGAGWLPAPSWFGRLAEAGAARLS
jgi:hypothetical protein